MVQATNPQGRALAEGVVRAGCEALQVVLAELLAAGDAVPDGMFADRRLIHDVVYELHLVSPNLLIHLMPTFSRDLQVGVRVCPPPPQWVLVA